jgi:hypothetical protein
MQSLISSDYLVGMWPIVCGPQDILYVVLPYFNYCGFKRRQELFIKFVHEIQNVKGVRWLLWSKPSLRGAARETERVLGGKYRVVLAK